MAKPSALAGVEDIKRRFWGRNISHFPQKLKVSADFNLCDAIYDQILKNIQLKPECLLTDENWRFSQELFLAENNPSAEKYLEKRFIFLKQRTRNPVWANQVPTCSRRGFGDGKRSIDLVHKSAEKEFDFIELKTESGSGNFLFAAMEVLDYGVLYLFRQQHCQIQAAKVFLTVMGPSEYYRGANLIDLALVQATINDQLAQSERPRMGAIQFIFRFKQMTNAKALNYQYLTELPDKEIKSLIENAGLVV